MPYETDEFKYNLIMWMLDQVRVRMPKKLRSLAPMVYAVEAEMKRVWDA